MRILSCKMKLFFVALLTIVLITEKTVKAEVEKYNAEEFILKKTNAFDECSKLHKISQEAIKDIMSHLRVADDQEVKCWLSCVAKKIEVIVEGKIDWERCNFISKLGLVTDEDKAKVDMITKICRAQGYDEQDECQLAYSAVACKIKNWNELGLPNGS